MKRLLPFAVAALTACSGPPGQDGRPGIIGPMGEKGDPGPGAPPGITAVFPRSVPQGLKTQVAISGTGTAWNDAASVSFGDGITVTRVRAASANALVVDLDVAPDAPVTTRDVTVTSGTQGALAYRNVFQVVPLTSVAVTGKPARGSLLSVTVTHNDPAFEFDTSWSGTSFTGVTAALNPAGVFVVRDVKPHSVNLLVGLDTDAPLGPRDLKLVNAWKRPSEVSFTFPALFDVADLAEQVVMTTMPLGGSLAQPFESALYKFTPASTSVEHLASVTTTNGRGTPMLVLVPTNGHFLPSSLAFINSYSFTPYALTDYRFVVVDPSGTPGVDYAVSVITPSKTAELEPDESIGMPMAVTVPSIITPATLSAQTDVDVYKVTVTPAELGRSLRVRTRAGDYSTDLKVELVLADGTAVMAPVDVAYHEDARSPALTVAGDYFVRLSWGKYTTAAWTTYSSRYELLLNWE